MPDLRQNASDEVREQLAVQWISWRNAHSRPVDVDTADKAPGDYLEQHG